VLAAVTRLDQAFNAAVQAASSVFARFLLLGAAMRPV
jgi:hypothetical protein